MVSKRRSSDLTSPSKSHLNLSPSHSRPKKPLNVNGLLVHISSYMDGILSSPRNVESGNMGRFSELGKDESLTTATDAIAVIRNSNMKNFYSNDGTSNVDAIMTQQLRRQQERDSIMNDEPKESSSKLANTAGGGVGSELQQEEEEPRNSAVLVASRASSLAQQQHKRGLQKSHKMRDQLNVLENVIQMASLTSTMRGFQLLNDEGEESRW